MALAIVLALAVVGVSAVIINSYSLDKSYSCSATATAVTNVVAVNLYSDLNCTVPLVAADLNPGTFSSESTSPVTKIAYFKASKSTLVPGGYGIGEIAPASVVVACTGLNTSICTFLAIVGEPFGSVIGGNHPCMITFSFIPAGGAGTTNFTIHVTGTGP
jgi:hypothetical protein